MHVVHSLSHYSRFKVLIDRAHDIDVADPEYFTKYLRYLNQEAFFADENATIPDYDAMPQRKTVRSDYDDVFEDSNWSVQSLELVDRCNLSPLLHVCRNVFLFRLFQGHGKVAPSGHPYGRVGTPSHASLQTIRRAALGYFTPAKSARFRYLAPLLGN